MARATIGGFAGFSPSAVLTLSAYATEMARSSEAMGKEVGDGTITASDQLQWKI
jgi:hypothetical protein